MRIKSPGPIPVYSLLEWKEVLTQSTGPIPVYSNGKGWEFVLLTDVKRMDLYCILNYI